MMKKKDNCLRESEISKFKEALKRNASSWLRLQGYFLRMTSHHHHHPVLLSLLLTGLKDGTEAWEIIPSLFAYSTKQKFLKVMKNMTKILSFPTPLMFAV